jgi:diguanylate cyclase (GGDEF)-like protein
MTIAERIRCSIEETEFQNMTVTVSVGLSEYRDHFDLEGFVKSADDAMYMAKHSGGNRVHTNIP